MNKTIFVIFALILTACAPIGTQALDVFTPTPDAAALYAEAIRAQRQYDEARGTAESYQGRITATAIAAAATQTRGAEYRSETLTAFNMAHTQAAYAATSTAAVVQATTTAAATATADAYAWRATQIADNAQATDDMAVIFARQTQMSIASESNRLALERERMTNAINAWTFPIAAIVFLAIFAGGVVFVARAISRRPTLEQTPDGTFAVFPQMVSHISRQSEPIITVHGVPVLPESSASQRQANALIAGVSAVRAGGAVGREVFAPPLVQVAPVVEQPPAVIDAEWRQVDEWRGPGFLIGQSQAGPVYIDPDKGASHLMVVGMTSSGKTRRCMLPVLAQALRAGWGVVLMNEAAGDYAALADHANLVRIGGKADDIANVLAHGAAEVERRDEVLRRAGVSTIGRMASLDEIGPRLILAVDELVQLAYSTDAHTGDEIWRQAAIIASKGRKCGVMFAFASTTITGRVLPKMGLTVRDNCARVAYRLDNQAASYVSVGRGGAETLADGHFLAQLGRGVIEGVGYTPDDEQVRSLVAKPVARVEQPDWLALPETAQTNEKEVAPEDAERIREMLRAGNTYNDIGRAVFGYPGGWGYKMVKEIEAGMVK